MKWKESSSTTSIRCNRSPSNRSRFVGSRSSAGEEIIAEHVADFGGWLRNADSRAPASDARAESAIAEAPLRDVRVVRRIVLGTRGSELARAQTSLVEAALRATQPNLEVAIEIITTRGDEKRGPIAETIDPRAGRKGLFTGEIERALLGRQIDVAIHSAKDLPSEATPGLEICAALPRAAVEDVLVMKAGADLATLSAGSSVATGSVRRQHQLRWLRPDLNVHDLRGNVPTRLRKLIANSWDAIILARAGLERLGFDCSRGAISFEGSALIIAILPTDQFMPAGGQGIVALADPKR